MTAIKPRARGLWHPVEVMFISVKRHEREKQELISAGNRLTDSILKTSSAGLFLMDSKGKIQPQVSESLGSLFRRQDFANLTVEKLIAPLVSAKTLSLVRTHMTHFLEPGQGETAEPDPLLDVEVKLTNADGSLLNAHYSFEFSAVEIAHEARSWMVRVTDITARTQQHRELEDLRVQVLTQGEILRSVLQAGAARFGAFLQRTDASMNSINGVLKKPAREAGAFRNKLEETLEEVDRIRRDAAALKLTGLQTAARDFEDALQELRSRETLSGSDFLPLAVKLDALYGHFAMLRSLTSQAGPLREAEPAAPEARITENGTQVIEAPQLLAELAQRAAPAAQRMAAVGSLESTLTTLTDLVAQENHKIVVLACSGLELVPTRYQATVKNVAIQLIRNAVVHGIETAAEREAAGKQVYAALRLEFKAVPGNGFELTFQDDGRGLDPGKVRDVAVAKGILTAEEARLLRDRQAIKLIFKPGFTTMTDTDGDTRHGTGMSLVRRYVHEAGGKIALASQVGRETRFKVTLPTLEMAIDAQVA
ncbi:MAG: two-component system, chemotaxis family, sensor kinase CheA [Gammaproteobacteria bacterium]|nr:two-component system, chemotaxis family, sensor kinase CheA [Gammaproteobacteria bacterium]